MDTKLFVFASFVCISVSAQEIPDTIEIPGIPQPLEWVITPDKYKQDENSIEIIAGPKTNMLYAPHGNFRISNMPKLFLARKPMLTTNLRVKLLF